VLDLERRLPIDPADGNEERLTASEFDLLKILAENPNRPLMRDWLLEVTAHREADASEAARSAAFAKRPGERIHHGCHSRRPK
jgi:DNA-binding response OmpR family regulator